MVFLTQIMPNYPNNFSCQSTATGIKDNVDNFMYTGTNVYYRVSVCQHVQASWQAETSGTRGKASKEWARENTNGLLLALLQAGEK